MLSMPNRLQEVKALGEPRALELPEEGASVEFEDQGPFASSVARLRYSSLVTPPSTIDFDLETGETGRHSVALADARRLNL